MDIRILLYVIDKYLYLESDSSLFLFYKYNFITFIINVHGTNREVFRIYSSMENMTEKT